MNDGKEGIPVATKLSARNKIEGKIVELEVDGVMAHVTVQVGKNLIESVITRRSAEEMKLKVGDRVSAVIKSTEVMLQKGRRGTRVSFDSFWKGCPMRRTLLAAVILFLLGFSAWAQQAAPPKPSNGPSDFKISGAVTTPLDLTVADLKAMP